MLLVVGLDLGLGLGLGGEWERQLMERSAPVEGPCPAEADWCAALLDPNGSAYGSWRPSRFLPSRPESMSGHLLFAKAV